jgi:hypothetical protein
MDRAWGNILTEEPGSVIPAKAGIQDIYNTAADLLDARFRGHDGVAALYISTPMIMPRNILDSNELIYKSIS